MSKPPFHEWYDQIRVVGAAAKDATRLGEAVLAEALTYCRTKMIAVAMSCYTPAEQDAAVPTGGIVHFDGDQFAQLREMGWLPPLPSHIAERLALRGPRLDQMTAIIRNAAERGRDRAQK